MPGFGQGSRVGAASMHDGALGSTLPGGTRPSISLMLLAMYSQYLCTSASVALRDCTAVMTYRHGKQAAVSMPSTVAGFPLSDLTIQPWGEGHLHESHHMQRPVCNSKQLPPARAAAAAVLGHATCASCGRLPG